MKLSQLSPNIIKSILQVNIHCNNINDCYYKNNNKYSNYKKRDVKLSPIFMKFIKCVNKSILYPIMIGIKYIKNIIDYNIGITEIKFISYISCKTLISLTVFHNHTFINKTFYTKFSILYNINKSLVSNNKLIYYDNNKYLNLLNQHTDSILLMEN